LNSVVGARPHPPLTWYDLPPKQTYLHMSVEEFETWSLYIGLGGLIGLMIFIVWNLGKESKAGKFGMFVLFLALGLGLLGFLIKLVLVELLQP
jgi:hypothetical protein